MPEPLEPEFVRVKDRDTKHEYSVVASAYDEKVHELLKNKAAVHTDGTALPAKHYIAPSSLSSSTSSGGPVVAPSGQKAKLEGEAD